MRTDLDGVTPTLPDAIQILIDATLAGVRTCLPAKIVTYYPATQYADVQPQLMGKRENGALYQYPVVPNVPVKHPRARAGKTRIHMPLQPGDDVTLIIADRSLDNWKTQGGMTDPADRRRFNLTDAYALVGGSAEPDAFPVTDPTSIEIVNETGVVQIKPDGTVNLGSTAPALSGALGERVEARLAKLEQGLTQAIADLQALGIVYTAHIHNIVTPVPGSPVGPAIAPAVPPSPFVADTSVVSSGKVKVVP